MLNEVTSKVSQSDSSLINQNYKLSPMIAQLLKPLLGEIESGDSYSLINTALHQAEVSKEGSDPSIDVLHDGAQGGKWQPDKTPGSGAYIDKNGNAVLNSGSASTRIGSTLIMSPVGSDIAALKAGDSYTLSGHVSIPKGMNASQLGIKFSKYGQEYTPTVDANGNFSVKIVVPPGGITALYLTHDKYGDSKDALSYTVDSLKLAASGGGSLPKDAKTIESNPDFKKYVAGIKQDLSDYAKKLGEYNSATSLVTREADAKSLEKTWEKLRGEISAPGLSKYIACQKAFQSLDSVKNNLPALTNLILKDLGFTDPQDPSFALPDDAKYSWQKEPWVVDQTQLPSPQTVPGQPQNSYIDSSGNLIFNSVNHTASSMALDSDSCSSLKGLKAGQTYTYTGQLSMLVPQGQDPSSLKRLFVVINGQQMPVTFNKDGTFSVKFTVPQGGIQKFQMLLDKDWLKPPQKPQDLQIKISDVNLFKGDVGNVEQSRMTLDGNSGIGALLSKQSSDFITKYGAQIKTLNGLIDKAENDPNKTKAQYKKKMQDFQAANAMKSTLEKEMQATLGSDKQALSKAAAKLLPGISAAQLQAAVSWVFDDQVMSKIPAVHPLDKPPVPNTSTDGLNEYSEMFSLYSDSNFSNLIDALRGTDPGSKDKNIEAIAQQMGQYVKDLKSYQQSYASGTPDPKLYAQLVSLSQNINAKTRAEFKTIIQTSKDPDVQAIANLWTKPDGSIDQGLQNAKIEDLFSQLTSADAGGWHVSAGNLIPPPPPPGCYMDHGKLVDAPSMIKNGDFSSKSLDDWQSNYPDIGKYAEVETPSEDHSDTSLPQGYMNSLHITTTKASGHVELHQYVEPVTPGQYYMVSWYQQGDQAGVTVDGAGGSDADPSKPYSQAQVGQPGKAWTRQYMWVKASAKDIEKDPTTGKQCLKVSIYADHPYGHATETHSAFKDIRVTPLSDPMKGESSYQADQVRNQDFNRLANEICPPFGLNPDLNSWGQYPLAGSVPQLKGPIQFPSNGKPGGNLLDPSISNWKGNTGKHGTPFWGIGAGVQQINEKNGSHGLTFQDGGVATAYPKIGVVKGNYQFQERVYVPEGESSAQVNIGATNNIDQKAGEPIIQKFDHLTPGWHTVTVNVDPTKNPSFFQGPTGAQYKLTIETQSTGGNFDATGFKLTSTDKSVYQAIRTNNPYDPNSFNNSNKHPNNYDINFGGGKEPTFNNHNASDPTTDWRDKMGIATSGNDMLNAQTTKDYFNPDDPKGLKITNTVDAKGVAKTGGFVGKTPLPSGANWDTSIDFSMKCTGKDHPTIGFWTYGEKMNAYQGEAHNGGPSHRITESDIEIGSDDPTKKVASDQGYRARDYEGYVNGGGNSQGGKSAALPTDPQTGKPLNLYDGTKWRLSIQQVKEKDGVHIIKTATKLDSTGQPIKGESFTLSDHNFGDVVTPPQYVKFGLENPDWNKEGHQEGSASAYITNFHEQTFGAKMTADDIKKAQEDPQTGGEWSKAVAYDNTSRQIPMKDTDFLVNNSDKGDNVGNIPDSDYYTGVDEPKMASSSDQESRTRDYEGDVNGGQNPQAGEFVQPPVDDVYEGNLPVSHDEPDLEQGDDPFRPDPESSRAGDYEGHVSGGKVRGIPADHHMGQPFNVYEGMDSEAYAGGPI